MGGGASDEDEEDVFGGGDSTPEVQALAGGAEDHGADDLAAEMPAPAADGAHPQIAGIKVSVVKGRVSPTHAAHTYADRWATRCCNEDHEGRAKSRSTGLHKDILGLRAAEAFLGAWAAKASESGGADLLVLMETACSSGACKCAAVHESL